MATTSIVADWARAVGGDRVHVTQILQPNVDPHDFEPGADAAKAVAEADVVLASGAGLDEWADDLVASGGGDAPLVELAPEDVAAARRRCRSRRHDHADEHGHDHGDVDPHFWHDPTLAAAAVGRLGEALAAADPADAATFRAGAAAYEERARAPRRGAAGHVRHACRRRTASSSPTTTRWATSPATSASTVVGAAIPSTSTAADASAGEIARAHRRRSARSTCRAVFSEASVDPARRRAASRTRPARRSTTTCTATPSARRTPTRATYVAMMRHNARVIAEGLDG